MTRIHLDDFSKNFWGASLKELTLPSLLLRQLKRRGSETLLIDAFLGDRTLNGYQTITIGLLMARWLKENVKEKRVGIVLPTGMAAFLVNLGCVLAGKIPVNLNFTAGRSSNESCIQKAGIQSIFTVAPMIEKFPNFPWGDQPHDVKAILTGFSKTKKITAFLQSFFLPPSCLSKSLQIPDSSTESEAALLFTSGSSGEPKGVVLTHRNILSNVLQVHSALRGLELDSLLGSLPVFHSFGFTVTLWWPLLGGPKVVTYPSPTETKALAETIERHQIKLLLSTPTFLRAFIRRATREQLRSLKMIVTGAEKLPQAVLEGFESKFGTPVCEGYGMTEATPVVSVNLLESNGKPGAQRKIGTVGKPLADVQVEIRDPFSEAVLSSGSGMIWIKGPNVFSGYLNDPERSDQVLKQSWYKTGDLGFLDETGFLVVEGRLSRFSKIGGEMVPHGVVEEKIQQVLGISDSEILEIAIAGVLDERKGEALLILTTREIDLESLRHQLLEQGLPALWIPRRLIRAKAIPTLASGKLDLKGLQELANLEGTSLS